MCSVAPVSHHQQMCMFMDYCQALSLCVNIGVTSIFRGEQFSLRSIQLRVWLVVTGSEHKLSLIARAELQPLSAVLHQEHTLGLRPCGGTGRRALPRISFPLMLVEGHTYSC